MAEKPMQTMLLPQINAPMRYLVKMDLVIMVCVAEPGFITSDNPCVCGVAQMRSVT